MKSDEEAGVGDLSMKVEDKGRECDSGAKYIRVNYRQGFMNLINLMPGNPDGNNWINWSNSSGLTTILALKVLSPRCILKIAIQWRQHENN